MKQFRLIDNIAGWVVFAIAAFTYVSTIEPTASFWDCPEFITTAFKLEVGHPPGAPFFMLMGNIFSQFASDTTQVARMVNIMSALMSAACILFLFWSITHLCRKLVPADSAKNVVTIEFAGLVGALAYCWSDTFWFSAVEGEVYASSSLFTAVVFWLMLKWEEHADAPQSDRWLILIAFLTGISIGVHLLNLLCLPALVLIYYYKRVPTATAIGSLAAVAGSGVLVAVVLYGIVPGIVKVGGWFELLFVNQLGFGFNTGMYVYIAVLVACVLWSLYETTRQSSRARMVASFVLSFAMLGIPFYGYGWGAVLCGVVVIALLTYAMFFRVGDKFMVSARLMNTSLLCALMIMLGYSSYAVIVIRSEANPPMDQNSPEDIFTLGSYLSREQYGSRPLFYGQAYSSQVELRHEGDYCVPVSVEGAPVYQRVEKHSADEPDKYEVIRHEMEYKYAQNMFFPRMYSDRHTQAYEDWLGGVKGYEVPYDQCGQIVKVKMPTQWDNIKFFWSYQVCFMYWRYFMWNFAGRQNDIQGNGEIEHGNWLTGIPFIDNARLGDQSLLPDELKENKGHNVFFCLPLLLGLIGLFWQTYRGREGEQQLWVVFFLFFMTGLAIVLYLNQTPQQPRERDYAYAGSFYAFAIWIGLGVAALVDMLRRYAKIDNLWANVAVGVLCTLVPLQMVSQTWDDHDRSGRYTCRDFGLNYLNSLDDKTKPVIFTNGDNDTFPLWYAQETEGERTDARVCNLSYLQTDWYIDQMRRPAYDSPSLPISWSRLQYVSGTREGIRVEPNAIRQVQEILKDDPEKCRELLGDNPYELSNVIDRWVLNDNKEMQIIPSDSLVITIDKEAVRRSGMMIAGDSIPDVMNISLKGKRYVYKSEMMMLEMLARANWERPLYVAVTVGESNYGNLGRNFVQEGLANRITPFNTAESGKRMDTERMYDNLMNKFRFGGLDVPGLYIDETVMRMCQTHRRLYASLATQLMREGQPEKAMKLVDRVQQGMSTDNVPHCFQSGSLDIAQVMAQNGKEKEASAIVDAVEENSRQYMAFYNSLSPDKLRNCAGEVQYNLYILRLCAQLKKSALGVEEDKAFKHFDFFCSQFQNKGLAM